MANANVTLKKLIGGVVTELYPKSTTSQILDPKTQKNLADVLAEVIETLGKKATAEDLTALQTKFNNLVTDAPEALDTLKEIADYIAAHQEVVDALNAAIGNKADKSAVNTLQALVDGIKSTVDGLGALATKNTVAETDLDDALKQKIANISVNAGMLNELTEDVRDTRAVANSKSTIYYSATQPQNLAEGDMWVQLVD